MLADGDAPAELLLEVARSGQVVSVGVSLQVHATFNSWLRTEAMTLSAEAVEVRPDFGS